MPDQRRSRPKEESGSPARRQDGRRPGFIVHHSSFIISGRSLQRFLLLDDEVGLVLLGAELGGVLLGVLLLGVVELGHQGVGVVEDAPVGAHADDLGRARSLGLGRCRLGGLLLRLLLWLLVLVVCVAGIFSGVVAGFRFVLVLFFLLLALFLVFLVAHLFLAVDGPFPSCHELDLPCAG